MKVDERILCVPVLYSNGDPLCSSPRSKNRTKEKEKENQTVFVTLLEEYDWISTIFRKYIGRVKDCVPLTNNLVVDTMNLH